MNLKSIQECDRRRAQKLLNFKLPNSYKKIGWICFAISFGGIFLTKFFDGDVEVLKEVLKKTSLVFLFVVVLSREKIEDERIQNFRAQSFSFAFLAGVLYILLQPLFNWLVFAIVKPEKAVFEDLGDFQVLWFMLFIYLMFFNISKRWH